MWQVNDGLASLETDGLTARVSLSDPSQGVSEIRFGDTLIHQARFLQLLEFSKVDRQAVPDTYVRGLDLVAMYNRDNDRGLHRQVDWKPVLHPDLPVVGLELVVSLHTDLLEDDATLRVHSDLSSTQSLYLHNASSGDFLTIESPGTQVVGATGERSEVGLFLHRLVEGAGSFVEMIHPADFTSTQIERDGRDPTHLQTTSPLFAEQLEKGVIRRARAQALFLPTANDQTTALECYRRFVNSPLPLTV